MTGGDYNRNVRQRAIEVRRKREVTRSLTRRSRRKCRRPAGTPSGKGKEGQGARRECLTTRSFCSSGQPGGEARWELPCMATFTIQLVGDEVTQNSLPTSWRGLKAWTRSWCGSTAAAGMCLRPRPSGNPWSSTWRSVTARIGRLCSQRGTIMACHCGGCRRPNEVLTWCTRCGSAPTATTTRRELGHPSRPWRPSRRALWDCT